MIIRRRILANRENKLSMRLIFFMIITIIAFFLRDSISINIPVIFFFIYYAICFFMLERHELLLFFMFLIPLSVGPLLYYVNVIFGLIFIIKNFSWIRINRAVMVSFALIIWEGLHLLPNVFLGYNESIIKYLGFALCLLITVLCISNEKLRGNFYHLILSWSLGLASFCSILLVKYIYQFGINNFVKLMRRFGWVSNLTDISSTSLLINPNTLGKLIILTTFSLLTLIKFENKHSKKLVLLIIYLNIFGLLTASRGFLLVLAILLFAYVIEIFINIKTNKKMAIILLVILVLVLSFSVRYIKPTLDLLRRRIESGNISGSRFEIYQGYLSALLVSPYIIFGSGMQEYTDKFNIDSSAHNVFIEVVSIWGIIGLFIVILLFIVLYKSMKIKKNLFIITILPYLPLLGLLLKAQTGQFFISYYHVFPTVIFTFLNVKYADTKIRESKVIKS